MEQSCPLTFALEFSIASFFLGFGGTLQFKLFACGRQNLSHIIYRRIREPLLFLFLCVGVCACGILGTAPRLKNVTEAKSFAYISGPGRETQDMGYRKEGPHAVFAD